MNIGIIGLGDMGRLYAKAFAKAGYTVSRLRPARQPPETGRRTYPFGITVMDHGSDVARINDLIIYSVEAESMERVVAEYGPSTKYGAIVAGQTSVKSSGDNNF
jgi:prephenate dehydrogenase (NADP+)